MTLFDLQTHQSPPIATFHCYYGYARDTHKKKKSNRRRCLKVKSTSVKKKKKCSLWKVREEEEDSQLSFCQSNHLLLLSLLLLFTTRAIGQLHEMLQCKFSEQVIAGHANKWVVVVVCSAQKRVKDHLNISPPIRAVNCYLREQRTAKRLKVRVNRRRRGNLFIQLKRKK